jgi:hypothetical protein
MFTFPTSGLNNDPSPLKTMPKTSVAVPEPQGAARSRIAMFRMDSFPKIAQSE